MEKSLKEWDKNLEKRQSVDKEITVINDFKDEKKVVDDL